MDYKIKNINIETDAGRILKGRHYKAGPSSTLVVILPAAGVSQTFYASFSEYIANQGLSVITFDFRGIGLSKDISLPKEKVNLSGWIDDAENVLKHIQLKFPSIDVVLLGHSFGAQITGVLKNIHQVKKVVFVGALLGYWRNYPILQSLILLFYWKVFVPTLSSLVGYFPASKFGLGEDLPKSAALEWSKWCTSPNYLVEFILKPNEQYLSNITMPVDVFRMTDDLYAPKKASLAFEQSLSSKMTSICELSPHEFGVKKIGHFGIFQKKNRSWAWPLLLDALSNFRNTSPAKPILEVPDDDIDQSLGNDNYLDRYYDDLNNFY